MKNSTRIKGIVIACASVLAIIFLIILFSFIIPTNKYNAAITLMNEKNYAKAISAFENLDDFRDSQEKITECKYMQATEFMKDENYLTASNAFLAMQDYKDSADKSTECMYLYSLKLAENKEYEKAIETLQKLENFKDSKSKISEITYLYATELADQQKYSDSLKLYRQIYDFGDSSEQIIKLEKSMLKSAQKGDIVLFGTYNQDENEENGNEEIEWLVIDKKADRILVISKNILANRQFHRVNKEITWDISNLRKWLDWNFEEDAFTDKEKDMIIKVTLENTDNPIFDADGGPDTEDKIFILGYEEIKEYFPDKEDRIASGCGTSKWWIRTPAGYNLKNFVNSFFHGSGSGGSQFCPCYVNVDGDIYAGGEGGLITDPCGIRPAMWISTK